MKLGVSLYPYPKGKVYTEKDLCSEDKVIELFGYCGILDAFVTEEGWRFLIDFYGYEKMYKMDKEAMYHDNDSLTEYIDWVNDEIKTLVSEKVIKDDQ